MPSLDPAEDVPEQVAEPEACRASNDERQRGCAIFSRQASGQQQQRERRQRRAEAFEKRRRTDDRETVSEELVQNYCFVMLKPLTVPSVLCAKRMP